jgi:branched-chain amino acid transport system substrate-binding protein
MKTIRLYKTLLASATVAAFAAFAAGASAQDIKLGYNGDLSASPSAQSGQAAVLGMEAAIVDINAAGGVLGKKLAKVVAVFGPTNSGNAMAWKHIANQKKIPVLGNVGSGTDITKPMSPGADNYMFRVSMVDREQVAALMAYVKKNTAGSKVVGLMAETTGYGQGGLKDMEEIAKLQDIKIAATERFGVGDTDMTSQLSKMKAANVDTVVVWAQGTPIAQLVRSMEKINYFPLTLTSWAADNITFYDAAGKALAEKPIFMRTVSETRTPAQQKLFDRIGSKLKAPGSFSFALHGYDSMQLLAQAMKQANSTDGAAVRAALEDLKTPVQGVLKTYDKPFSKTNHEALTAKDLVWIRWKDGKLLPYSDALIGVLKPADFNQ